MPKLIVIRNLSVRSIWYGITSNHLILLLFLKGNYFGKYLYTFTGLPSILWIIGIDYLKIQVLSCYIRLMMILWQIVSLLKLLQKSITERETVDLVEQLQIKSEDSNFKLLLSRISSLSIKDIPKQFILQFQNLGLHLFQDIISNFTISN